MYKEVSSILCEHLKDHNITVDTKVTEEIIMIATLECKNDLISTIELYPNHFDKYSKKEETYFNEKIAKKNTFPIGDLAFWDDDQKYLEKKYHGIIERIEMKTWSCYFDQHARFCHAMDGVTYNQVSKLPKNYPDEGFDFSVSRNRIIERYTSVSSKSKSGYIIVTHDEFGDRVSAVPTLKIHVDMKFDKNFREEIRIKTMQILDMGTVDDVIENGNGTSIVYDKDEDFISNHAKEIAHFQKDGINIQNIMYPITSIVIPPNFNHTYKTLEDAGATVVYFKDKCLIESKSGKLQQFEVFQKDESPEVKNFPTKMETKHVETKIDENTSQFQETVSMYDTFNSNTMSFSLRGIVLVVFLYL